MSQHTPGPWTLIRDSPKRTSNYDKLYRLPVYAPGEDKRPGIPKGYAIVAYGLSHHRNEARANAHLIAKAPELLDLLKMVIDGQRLAIGSLRALLHEIEGDS